MSTDLPDGIYLDLSFENYLAQPRISSGDLTNMIEGPPAYWANSPMNPDREEREETEPMKLGRAYHCARLEPETFDDLYIQELDAEDMPKGALMKDTEYKAWLKENGEAQTKAGETVTMRALRIEADHGGPPTWHVSRGEWEEANVDKTWINRKHMAEIKRDAARIRMNPELEALISGGLPEVSILWTDADTGLQCKCRPDYLGPNWITHLKTWDTKSFGKPGNQSIVDAFRFNGHYRTGWFYHLGLCAMEGLQFVDRPGPAEWTKPQAWKTWFLYVRRSGIPDIRAREIMYFNFPRGVEEHKIGAEHQLANFQKTASVIARKADIEVRRCLEQIKECGELYGTAGEPWFPRDMIGTLVDDDFSDYWLDSTIDPR